MNHYPHHIGDFNNATRHLTRIERSIYRDLLDLYYDTEAPIPAETEWVCRRILAGSQEERAAVGLVLSEFFTKDGNVYRNARCDAEIAAYQARRDRARANGCKGGRPAAGKKTKRVSSGMPEGTQKKTNQNQNQNQNQCSSPTGDERAQGDQRTLAGDACRRLKAEAGLMRVHPSDPHLVAALEAGVTADQLVAVALEHRDKPLAYVAKAALGRRNDAAALAAGGPHGNTASRPGRALSAVDSVRVAAEAAGHFDPDDYPATGGGGRVIDVGAIGA